MSAYIRHSFVVGNYYYAALHPILKSKNVSRAANNTTQSLLKTVLIYGGEAWVLTKRSEGILNKFKSKVLQKVRWKIYGHVNEGNIFIIRTNEEMRNLY